MRLSLSTLTRFAGRSMFFVLVSLVTLVPSALAQNGTAATRSVTRTLPASVSGLRLDAPIEATGLAPLSKVDAALMTAGGPQQVVVRLTQDAVAAVAARGGDEGAQFAAVQAQQAQIISRVLQLDPSAKLLGSAKIATNVVMFEMSGEALNILSAEASVVAINPVVEYQIVLDETVPYIGATTLHEDFGLTGDGVQVAVLDSGIDYTHFEFGGAGTAAAYAAAYGASPADPLNTTTDGLFPTAKVVGGYDFIGEAWTGSSTPLIPDPDPIDFQGHGSHVADIIGGARGVAPDADLWALKVCSAISTSCSGVGLIQAMDFVLDPNGDGRTRDHLDIVNMSLGSLYGQAFDDDLSQAVNNATRLGVLSVTAAGNAADKPYIVDSPSAAYTALSVAQTEVPSATQPFMNIVSPAAIAGNYVAVFQGWSAPLTAPIEAPVQYGDGAGGNLNGCNPFVAGSLAGKIVLVDRGVCSFSIKVTNVYDGGGLIAVIAQNSADPPFGGAFGGGNPAVPGYMISRADGLAIKGQLAVGVVARFDPAIAEPLVGTVVPTSARGPSMLTNIIKPEIGAPGASVSAQAGTGTGRTSFGGTSGATPMVAGSAALLMEAYPHRGPMEIKSVLVNTGYTNIFNTPAFLDGDLAPITRIGGGEVRVDQAFTSPSAVYDALSQNPTLSFGLRDVTDNKVVLLKLVAIHNYSNQKILYRVTPTFRFAGDDTGAVKVEAPQFIWVGKRDTVYFPVKMTINGALLAQWTMNSGGNGSNANVLTNMEYDGYINFDNVWSVADNNNPLHIPWHVLPRQSGKIKSSANSVNIGTTPDPAWGVPTATATLKNNGVGAGYVDSYSLIATSPNLPEGGRGANSPIIDLRYVGVATFPVPAGFCSGVDSFVMQFAVNTWERQTHAIAPASFFFDIDVDNDGVYDYEVFNYDFSFPANTLGDGRNVTWAVNLATGDGDAFFFTEHGTNSGNTTLTICGEQIGLNASNFFQPMTITGGVVDIYFTGNVTDTFDPVSFSALGERYLGVFDGTSFGTADIASGATSLLTILDFGPLGTNPSETGLLILLDGPRGAVRGGAPANKEVQVITVNH